MNSTIAEDLTRLQSAKTNIANAIIAKGVTLSPEDGFEDFSSAIAAIPTSPSITVEPLSVSTNGTYIASSGAAYNPIEVDVQPNLMSKSITVNGTYTATQDSVDGYSQVTVAVEPDLITKSISANGTYIAASENKDGFSEVTVLVEPDLMSKNISVNGTYIAALENKDGYSEVNVNVQPNLTTKNITVNGTYTAAAENKDGFSEVTVAVPSGGNIEVPENDIIFIDYNGKILYSYTKDEFLQLTELPALSNDSPTCPEWWPGTIPQNTTTLDANRWNWSLIDAQAYLQHHQRLTIGQVRHTSDGTTKIFTNIKPGMEDIYIGLSVKGEVEIDFGDGTVDTATGNSDSYTQYTHHVYPNSGYYIITIKVISGCFTFYSSSYGVTSILRGPGANSRYGSSYNGLLAVWLGNNAYIGRNAFNYAYNLLEVSIPEPVYRDSDAIVGSFSYTYNLNGIVLPNGSNAMVPSFERSGIKRISISEYNTMREQAFNYCNELKRIEIPDNCSIGSYAFRYSGIESIEFPYGQTSLGNSILNDCYRLSELIIPEDVTNLGQTLSINNSADSALVALKFKSSTPPTISYHNIPTWCIIYVPVGSLADYTSASGYPSPTSYQYVEY